MIMNGVSIVMSVYNGETFLKEAIISVLQQSYSPFEFIIINDGSTDNTINIIRELAKNNDIIKYKSIPHSGQATALNFGIDLCIYPNIARIDADDIWHPDKLEKQMSYLIKHPDIKLIGCSVDFINKKGIKINQTGFNLKKELFYDDIKKKLLRYNIFCHSSVVFKKSIFYDAGRYNEKFKISMDYDLWIRISDIGKTYIMPDILVSYRISDKMTSKKYFRLLQKESLIIHLINYKKNKFNIKFIQKLLLIKDILRLYLRSIFFLHPRY